MLPREDITLVTNVFPSIPQGFPFGHQSLPFGNQGPRFHSSIYIILKWSVSKNERTKNELTDQTESRTMSVISLDILMGVKNE